VKIVCTTTFDITATGVTGHYRVSRVPFLDWAGRKIANEQDWHKSRNQQRNWETLQQLLSLRTQVFSATQPMVIHNCWQFEFEVESADVYGQDLSLLQEDCEGVPMLTGLTETELGARVLVTQGPGQNLWFRLDQLNSSVGE
jgi:hypothetical protein